MPRTPLALAALLLAAASLPARAVGQTLTKTLLTGSIPDVVYVTSPPGDASRLFAVRKSGRIRVIKDGVVLATSFLNIGVGGGSLVSSGSEQGLLGLAFHPNYAQNGWFYVSYTDAQGDSVVARYSVSADPDLADPTSATIVLGPVPQPEPLHNAGCIQFGPDGKLYVALGDGGSGSSQTPPPPWENSQSPASLLGKLLRLDVDLPFPHVPLDNPFVSDPNTLDLIWHLGLRNPWRFSFDRATGELYVGDVGESAREEIDIAPAGAAGLNFGWVCKEGSLTTAFGGPGCASASLIGPAHEYVHAPGANSVVGGYVYRGCAIPALQGAYLFADVYGGRVWSFRWVNGMVTDFIDRTAELAVGGSVQSIASFGEDSAGELYLCDWAAGAVYRIESADPVPDCNSNGVADTCDIASGTSQDADGDGVPDECGCTSPAPFAYCTAKTNSLGCMPLVGFQGTPQVGNPAPFLVTCSQVLNNQIGILIYGPAQNGVPFQGGTLCVGPSVLRTSGQASGGNPGNGTDCSGAFAFDFNAHISSGSDPSLAAGVQVDAQYWSRDNGDAFGSSLSNALQFVICD